MFPTGMEESTASRHEASKLAEKARADSGSSMLPKGDTFCDDSLLHSARLICFSCSLLACKSDSGYDDNAIALCTAAARLLETALETESNILLFPAIKEGESGTPFKTASADSIELDTSPSLSNE